MTSQVLECDACAGDAAALFAHPDYGFVCRSCLHQLELPITELEIQK